MSTPSSDRPADGPAQAAAADGPTDPDAIKAEIEATREQLGRTVDELSQRLDVPARAKESAARAKDTAVETYRESPPTVVGAGAALVGLVGLLQWRRRRKRRRATPEGALEEARRARKRQAARARKERAARRSAAKIAPWTAAARTTSRIRYSLCSAEGASSSLATTFQTCLNTIPLSEPATRPLIMPIGR